MANCVDPDQIMQHLILVDTICSDQSVRLLMVNTVYIGVFTEPDQTVWMYYCIVWSGSLHFKYTRQ